MTDAEYEQSIVARIAALREAEADCIAVDKPEAAVLAAMVLGNLCRELDQMRAERGEP